MPQPIYDAQLRIRSGFPVLPLALIDDPTTGVLLISVKCSDDTQCPGPLFSLIYLGWSRDTVTKATVQYKTTALATPDTERQRHF